MRRARFESRCGDHINGHFELKVQVPGGYMPVPSLTGLHKSLKLSVAQLLALGNIIYIEITKIV